MLGSAPLEAVLGSGIDNRDHEAVRSFVRAAADVGLAVLFIYPDSKVPADMRTPQARRADDKRVQEAAKDAGRRDWARVKSPAGLALATSDKAVLERYLRRYIEVFSTWTEVLADGSQGDKVPYVKKRVDAGEIAMAEPVAVNLAVEVGGSGLVVIDCDTAAQMERWFEVSAPADGWESPEARPAPTVLTPGQRDEDGVWHHSDGGHFYFTVPDKYLPVLPRHIGAMTWGGDHGFAVLWDRRYVLIPPSTRPEGRYEQLGHVYPLPDWLAEKILEVGQHRVDRAAQSDGRVEGESTELSRHIDAWAQAVSWASILEPLGWAPAPRADSCGCAVWSALGPHASPKSATAHDTGCAAGRFTEVNAPLHLWTDHDAPPFTNNMDDPGWTPTFSKLQAVALIGYGGSVAKAMDDLGITPDHTVEIGLDPKGPDADLDKTGDGGFELPTDVEVTYSSEEPTPPDTSHGITIAPRPAVDADPPPLWCRSCEVSTPEDDFAVGEEGVLWHRSAEPGDTGHLADAEPPRSREQQLNDLGAELAEEHESPYPDEVEDADPDVFDSKHTGVPRIAPFSHWRDLPPPEYVIDGLVEHGGLSCVIGSPGIGKSTVALDMACHIATGKRWQGRKTLKTRVLYLPGEGLAGAVQRLRAWEAEHEIDLSDGLLLGNGIILVNAVNEAWGEVAAYISRQGVGMVIFDTFARMSAGLEENSATDVGRAVRRFDRIKELTSSGVIVVHHTGKHTPDVARGSSALNGALDSELLIRPATWDTSQIADSAGRLPGKPIELWTSKQKNCEQLDDPIPLLMRTARDVDAPVITGPNGDVDPMQGEIVLARPLPEPLVETAIRVRLFVDRLPQQGATRTELVAGVRPDSYANSRNDTAAYWKQRIAEAVDRGLRYSLIETLTGTPSGARYIPSTASTDDARARAASEINDGSD